VDGTWGVFEEGAGKILNPNVKARIKSKYQSPNDKNKVFTEMPGGPIPSFGFGFLRLIRISDFVLRIWPTRAAAGEDPPRQDDRLTTNAQRPLRPWLGLL